MDQDVGGPSKKAVPSVQLEFVSVTKDSYKHGKLRQHPTVRRHVMRHVMLDRSRRERIAATESFQQNKGQDPRFSRANRSPSSLSPIEGHSDEELWSKQTEAVKGEPNDTVELELVKQHPTSWELDPFNSFAAPLDRHTQAGLDYYAKVMVPATRPADPPSHNPHTRNVLSFVLNSDSAIDSFTAAMAIGRAMNVYASKSSNRQAPDEGYGPAQGLMTTGLAFVTRAMRKLNQQALRVGFVTDDSTIATVLELLVCEILMGDSARGEIHSQGLRAMIKTRGGPNSIPSFLMDGTFLSDMHMATLSHRPPSYALLDAHQSSLQTSLPRACSMCGIISYRCETLSLSEKLSARIDPKFFTGLVQLQDVVNYTNTFDKSFETLPVELRRLYLSKTFAVEHAILSQISPHSIAIVSPIADFCTIAVLLFIYTSIQRWSPYSPLVRIIVGQLQRSLTDANQEALLVLDPNLLLWSLFIGAYASHGQNTRPWFVALIRKISKSLLACSWTHVQACIMRCYYIDGLFGEAFEQIWLEADGNADDRGPAPH